MDDSTALCYEFKQSLNRTVWFLPVAIKTPISQVSVNLTTGNWVDIEGDIINIIYMHIKVIIVKHIVQNRSSK